MKAAAQLSREAVDEAADEAADEATASPLVNPEEQEIARKKILDNQYKCFEKMNRDLPYNKSGSGDIFCERRRCFIKFSLLMLFLLLLDVSGLYCSRNWDGWLCWDDTPAGTYTSQNCPNYFVDFDPTGELSVAWHPGTKCVYI